VLQLAGDPPSHLVRFISPLSSLGCTMASGLVGNLSRLLASRGHGAGSVPGRNVLDANAGSGAAVGQGPSSVAMQHNMQPELQQPHPQHFATPAAYLNGRIKSETNSDGTASPHPADQLSRYPSSQPGQQPPQYPSVPSNMANGMRYPSPTAMQNSMPMLNNNYMPNQAPDHYGHQAAPDQQVPQPNTNGRQSTGESGPPKAFACSTCGKGFARRSDLARHGS
jgi:hypothetical protein